MMPSAPSPDELAQISERLNLQLCRSEVDRYAELLSPFWVTLNELAEATVALRREQPPAPRREWRVPEAADNPFGAWAIRMDLSDSGVAAGPLEGRTVAIKDNIAVAGVPMSNGSALLSGYTPAEDASVVRRVLRAGGRITGKAQCEDLCMSGSSHTSATGPVLNPWDPGRVAGGSSSGCAVLVASGAADIAIGSDQGGSVRLPASWCGVVGLKPTWGLLPFTGAVSIDVRVDHLGILARTTADVALMMQVLAGRDGRDPRQPAELTLPDYAAEAKRGVAGLRIGLLEQGFKSLGDRTAAEERVHRSITALEAAGASVRLVSLPEHRKLGSLLVATIFLGAARQILQGDDFGMARMGQADMAFTEAVIRGLREGAGKLAPNVKMQLLGGQYLLDTCGGLPYAYVERLRPRVIAMYDRLLSDVDVLAMPTQPTTAPLIPGPDATIEESVGTAWGSGANTVHFNVTGHPSLSMPAGLAAGLPIGTMLVGRHGEDATLLRVAGAWEEISGGFPAAPVDHW